LVKKARREGVGLYSREEKAVLGDFVFRRWRRGGEWGDCGGWAFGDSTTAKNKNEEGGNPQTCCKGLGRKGICGGVDYCRRQYLKHSGDVKPSRPKKQLYKYEKMKMEVQNKRRLELEVCCATSRTGAARIEPHPGGEQKDNYAASRQPSS